MEQETVYPYGPVLASGILKSRPDDFRVFERLGFEPTGEGEHVFLLVEKSGLSTPELIEHVACDYSLDPKLIGHSGLKDKQARTQQWLSLHLPGKSLPTGRMRAPVYKVLQQTRHNRKLRPGSHSHNAFEIRLREVDELPGPSRQQLDAIAYRGFANYFGTQRFGRRQDNVRQALEVLPRRGIKRARKSILISALRSCLFNRILAQRIRRGHWELPMDGDVFMLRGSRSIFTDTLDEALIERYRLLDIASTGSLYGVGRKLLSGEPEAIEAEVFAECSEITTCLEQQGAKLQMRALRAATDNLSYDYNAADRSLLLKVELPSGCYVTTLLEHFIRLEDAG